MTVKQWPSEGSLVATGERGGGRRSAGALAPNRAVSEISRASTWSPVSEWDDDGWRDRAACRLIEADLFFPAGSTGSAVDQIQSAKAVCRTCPVTDACLRFALETNQEAGVWGGTDEDERRKLRKAWRAGRPRPTKSAAR